MNNTATFTKVIFAIAILLFAIITLFPFYMMMIMGTYVNEELYTGLKLLPGSNLINNLKTVLGVGFGHFYANSFIVATLSTFGGLTTSALGDGHYDDSLAAWADRICHRNESAGN